MIEVLRIHALVRMARVLIFIGRAADTVRKAACGRLARWRLRRRPGWMRGTRLTGGRGRGGEFYKERATHWRAAKVLSWGGKRSITQPDSPYWLTMSVGNAHRPQQNGEDRQN
jgi:hypothetical protein